MTLPEEPPRPCPNEGDGREHGPAEEPGPCPYSEGMSGVTEECECCEHCYRTCWSDL